MEGMFVEECFGLDRCVSSLEKTLSGDCSGSGGIIVVREERAHSLGRVTEEAIAERAQYKHRGTDKLLESLIFFPCRGEKKPVCVVRKSNKRPCA